MSGVTLKNAIKRYGDTQVIHGVDLQIDEGELIGRKRSGGLTSDRERLLHYHRPMAEDGTIEYTAQILDTVEGLTSPYTYSDMTGAGLKLLAPAG